MYSAVVVATVVDMYSGVVVATIVVVGKSTKTFTWIKTTKYICIQIKSKLQYNRNEMIVLTVITT